MEDERFQVFDFEALNWNRLYAIGVYDGKDYKYIAERNKKNSYFVSWLLDNLHEDMVAYAHNGGKYDFIFIFQLCEELGLKPYGIKLIHGSIGEFRLKYKDKRLIFRDSILILPAGLGALTKDFDVEHKKLKLSYEIGMEDSRFEDYFKNDVLGLYEVLERSGLTRYLTIAGASLSKFKNNFYNRKMERNEDDVEHFFRAGYKGGRTEIFKLYGKDLNYYDINSLYPSVMYDFAYPLPIKNNFKKVYDIDYSKLGIYDITAKIDNINIPVLHLNIDGKFIFPTGTIHGLFYTPEIKKAKEMGYDISVNYGYEFIKTDYIFRDYVKYYYNIKQNAKGSQRAIAKLMLNSLYGKFGQRREREITSLVYDGSYSNMNFIQKKYWDSTSDFIHPEIAGIVTSYARARLYELFQKAGLDNVYYCDTDSIFTDKELETSNKLGDIKLEGKIKEFIAIAPKLYSYIDDVDDFHIKAKGFKEAQFVFDDFKKGLFDRDLSKFVEQRDKVASFKERFKRNGIKGFGDLLNVNKHLRGFYDKRIVVDKVNTIPISI